MRGPVVIASMLNAIPPEPSDAQEPHDQTSRFSVLDVILWLIVLSLLAGVCWVFKDFGA